MTGRPTRRELVAGGAGIAAAIAAVGAAPADGEFIAGGGFDSPHALNDVHVLEHLLRAERMLEFGYQHVVQSKWIKPPTVEVVLLGLAHEQEHAALLERHISALRAAVRAPAAPKRHKRGSSSIPPNVARLLNDAQNERDGLAALVDIESLAQASYFNAVSKLRDPGLALAAAQILACEAQHWSVLVNLLHKGDANQVVPHPFVRGSLQLGPSR